MITRLTLSALALAAFTAPAFAHVDPAAHGSFMAGLAHPLSGLDHILAMVTVGLWAALIGGRALVAVPAAFVATMLFGFALAMGGLALPFVEPVVLASVVVLGLAVALARPLPLWAPILMVGFFALFHGFAHGAEMAGARTPGFVAGFASATVLLHAAGLVLGAGIGGLFADPLKRATTRLLGTLTALAGVALAFGA